MKRIKKDNEISTCKKLKQNDLSKNFVDSFDLDPLKRLQSDFYDQKCLDLCKNLIGKYLIRKYEDESSFNYTVGRIVEVEAYTGTDDPASHSFKKQTDRNKAMFMKAGTVYVYNIYGCYCCINISSKEPGAAVLIRALEPMHGINRMINNKNLQSKAKNKNSSEKNLTNGPSKLCMAFNISKTMFDQVDLATNENLWLQDKISADNLREENDEFKIVCAKRIGIDYAGPDAVNKLWRFYIKDNKHVSILSKEQVQLN